MLKKLVIITTENIKAATISIHNVKRDRHNFNNLRRINLGIFFFKLKITKNSNAPIN